VAHVPGERDREWTDVNWQLYWFCRRYGHPRGVRHLGRPGPMPTLPRHSLPPAPLAAALELPDEQTRQLLDAAVPVGARLLAALDRVADELTAAAAAGADRRALDDAAVSLAGARAAVEPLAAAVSS
jgi:hypothetical protein